MAAFIPYLYIRCQGDVSRSDSNANPKWTPVHLFTMTLKYQFRKVEIVGTVQALEGFLKIHTESNPLPKPTYHGPWEQLWGVVIRMVHWLLSWAELPVSHLSLISLLTTRDCLNQRNRLLMLFSLRTILFWIQGSLPSLPFPISLALRTTVGPIAVF